MKIRTRLTILFTFITATILFVFVLIIYLSAKSTREKEFYTLLKKEAVTKANLFLNAKVNAQTLHEIYSNNRKILNEVEVAIYDTSFNLLYHDALEIDIVKETPSIFDEILQKGEKAFYQDEWQAIGIKYNFQNKDFIITATAYDQYGYSKLSNLLRVCTVVFIISIVFIYISGRFFSKKAFAPVKEMSRKATQISATNLDLRISVNENNDELSELAKTFNEMLDRLESSFDSQKHFVSNISHELRTPLAALITELELSAGKERNSDEYKTAISNALNDAKKLVRLSNSLLDLAKASYDTSEIKFRQVRIDEILLDARQQIQQMNPEYKIDIHFESNIENDNQISVHGNEYLLKTAFLNLFENGCKFSPDQQSTVSISFTGKKIILRFSDKGIGIPQPDVKSIFIPFYRGENKKYAEGNGIGLSLTKKIITLHNGSISVLSKEKQGTTFRVELNSDLN